MIRKFLAAILVSSLTLLASPALSSSADFDRGEMIYFVMLDRFANGNPGNDSGGLGTNYKESGLLKSNNGFYHGGDLAGLTSKISYIKSLGFTAIWITPIVRQIAVAPDGASSAYHGYWGAGFDEVDPHLGTMADFKKFVDTAHQEGIKVILDIVTNHTADTIRYAEGGSYVSINDKPYREANGKPINLNKLPARKSSPTLNLKTSFAKTPLIYPVYKSIKSPSWLNNLKNYHNRGESSFAGESSEHGDFFGLDDVFTEKPEVVKGFIDVYSNWIEETGIDGFRIDTVKHVNIEFWQKFLPAIRDTAQKSGKNDFPMWAEIYDPDPNITSKWVRKGQFSEVLDFPFQQRVLAFVTERTAMPLATLFNSDDYYLMQGVDVNRLGTFLGNHDMGRIGAFIGLNRGPEVALKQNQLAHALLFTLRGTPIVYYGDEFGLMGGNDKNARQDLFATEVTEWQTEKRIGQDPIGKKDSFSTTNPLQETIRTLTALRSKYRAFTFGGQQVHHAGAGWLVFSRLDPTDGHLLLAAFNTNDDAGSIEFPIGLESKWLRLAGFGSLDSRSSNLELSLPGISWAVFRTEAPIPTKADSITLTRFRIDPLENSRYEIAARVNGQGTNELTFQYQDKRGAWQELGTDLSPTFSKNPPDNGLYRVFPERSSLPRSGTIKIRASLTFNGKELISPERSFTVKK